eukprot:8238809-Lingulodinium_polyedra.AAC.1
MQTTRRRPRGFGHRPLKAGLGRKPRATDAPPDVCPPPPDPGPGAPLRAAVRPEGGQLDHGQDPLANLGVRELGGTVAPPIPAHGAPNGKTARGGVNCGVAETAPLFEPRAMQSSAVRCAGIQRADRTRATALGRTRTH